MDHLRKQRWHAVFVTCVVPFKDLLRNSSFDRVWSFFSPYRGKIQSTPNIPKSRSEFLAEFPVPISDQRPQSIFSSFSYLQATWLLVYTITQPFLYSSTKCGKTQKGVEYLCKAKSIQPPFDFFFPLHIL